MAVKEALKFPFGVGFDLLFLGAGWLIPGLVVTASHASAWAPWFFALLESRWCPRFSTSRFAYVTASFVKARRPGWPSRLCRRAFQPSGPDELCGLGVGPSLARLVAALIFCYPCADPGLSGLCFCIKGHFHNMSEHGAAVQDLVRSQNAKPILLSSRPYTYQSFFALLLRLMPTSFGLKVFSPAKADGYTSDRYLAYCHATGYGDYEHGVFWFSLEPSAENFAKSAEVLFLGDSACRWHFHRRDRDWFSSASIRYYLLGFKLRETRFCTRTAAQAYARAKVYVISVDPFLGNGETPPARISCGIL